MQRVQKVQHVFVIPINVVPAFCVTHGPCRIPYLSGVQVCFVHESVKTAEVRIWINPRSLLYILSSDHPRPPPTLGGEEISLSIPFPLLS